MKSIPILLTVAALLALSGLANPGARGEESGQAAPAFEKASPYRAVTFAVPDLTKELGRSLSGAIAQTPGLVSARPDFEKKTFTVLFAVDKTSSADIHKALLTVASGAKIDREEAVAESDAKVNCNACPNRKSCPSQAAKKAEAKQE